MCVRQKASVCPHISYDTVMHEEVKRHVFECIGLEQMKNCIVLYESRQYWFYFFAMYKTRIPHANVINKVQWEVIKMCAIFGGTRLFCRASKIFKGGQVV